MKKLITLIVVIFLLLNVHVYNGLNKGLYIGASETCTAGIELVGDAGIFYNFSTCL